MFKVGDIIIGLPNAPYAWTGPGTRNKVMHVDDEKLKKMNLVGIESLEEKILGYYYLVNPDYFSLPDTNESAVLLLNKEE